MDSAVPPKIYEILKKVTNGDIKHFNISIEDPNKKGNGFLGQLIFISLRDNRNGRHFNLVVKQAFSEQNVRERHPIRDVFHNEIYFYEKLYPAFQKFQDRVPEKLRFVHVPKCFAAISEHNSERLVLDNLKYQGYVIHDKVKPLDKDTFEFIFKLYAKFHAISFAYKALEPEEFAELTKDVIDVWDAYTNKLHLSNTIKKVHQESFDCVKSEEVDDLVIEKYKSYVDDVLEIFKRSLVNGKCSVITHGDCWSNNMMFKYNDSGQPVDLRFLDFQIIRMASPACDLSYCLYSGGNKEIFDDLNHLLQVYHDSLSESLRAYGCNPDQLYPMKQLKDDWRLYCHVGVSLGLMIWRLKLIYEDNAVDLIDSTKEHGANKVLDTKYDKKTYMERSRDIILHLYDNGLLI